MVRSVVAGVVAEASRAGYSQGRFGPWCVGAQRHDRTLMRNEQPAAPGGVLVTLLHRRQSVALWWERLHEAAEPKAGPTQ